MLKKIIILFVFSIILVWCWDSWENTNILDNSNNWAIIDNNKVDESWLWWSWQESSITIENGFNN